MSQDVGRRPAFYLPNATYDLSTQHTMLLVGPLRLVADTSCDCSSPMLLHWPLKAHPAALHSTNQCSLTSPGVLGPTCRRGASEEGGMAAGRGRRR